MFGPFQEEFEEDEQQRKNKRELKYYRGINHKMVQQCKSKSITGSFSDLKF